MGFNSAFKGLNKCLIIVSTTFINNKEIRRTVRSCMFLSKLSSSSHFIHAMVRLATDLQRLATDLQRLPTRVPHRLRSSSSSFNLKYPLFSSRPSNSFLRLLPRRTVTSILPSYLQWRGLKAVRMQDMTNPVSFLLFYCM